MSLNDRINLMADRLVAAESVYNSQFRDAPSVICTESWAAGLQMLTSHQLAVLEQTKDEDLVSVFDKTGEEIPGELGEILTILDNHLGS